MPVSVTLTALHPSQVANAEILAKLYIERYDYRAAAAVYAALASRRSGVGDTALDLSERAAGFQCAVLQVQLPADKFFDSLQFFRCGIRHPAFVGDMSCCGSCRVPCFSSSRFWMWCSGF
jgi:hypothetical protein